MAQTRPSRWHPSRTLASTVLTWRDRAGFVASPTKRLTKTPSMPYCRIHLRVQQTGPFAEGAVEPGRRAIGHLQPRHVAQIGRVVLGNVGPHVDRESSAVGPIEALAPVGESKGRPVAGRVEPSLITAQNLAVERRGIDVRSARPFVRAQPWLIGHCLVGAG